MYWSRWGCTLESELTSASDPSVLAAFMVERQKNKWLMYSDMEIYVRKSIRTCPGKHIGEACFDIANISVYQQRQGTFTNWFNNTIAALPGMGYNLVYVESVINDHLCAHLRKCGLIEASTSYDVNFFLPIGLS